MKSTAFTLIELLVVIAILCILMALLFPLFAKAKQAAYVTQDVQQMRQVYLAVSLYEQDADDSSPRSLLYSEPYASSKQVFVSPVDPFRGGVPGMSDFPADMYVPDGTGPRSAFRISYGYLYPMAASCGWTDDSYRQARSHPGSGMISMKMYNDVAPFQFLSHGIDLYRKNLSDYRIRMDGSFQTFHMSDGWSNSCSLNFCFGPDLPVDGHC